MQGARQASARCKKSWQTRQRCRVIFATGVETSVRGRVEVEVGLMRSPGRV